MILDNIPRYISGNEYNFSAIIKDKNENLIDPTTVTFIFKKPDGTRITFTSPDVVRNSIGDYSINYAPIALGRWHCRAVGDSLVVAGEGTFIVESNF